LENPVRYTDPYGLSVLPFNLHDSSGLTPDVCGANNGKKKKDPKCKKPRGAKRAAWIFYFACKLFSKNIDDAQDGGIGSPRAPKLPKPDKEIPTEPHTPKRPPIDPKEPLPPKKNNSHFSFLR